MLDLNNIYLIVGAGGLGSLISELLRDNCIELPKKIGARFSLGVFGSMIVGAIAGYYVDGSLETAFMAGFMGPQLLGMILKKRLAEADFDNAQPVNAVPETPAETEKFADIETMIRWKAAQAKVDPELAVAIAKCESGLNAKAVNINKTGSKDRGLYQWNDYYHPEITDGMAFDPEMATDLFLKAVNDGNISWWNASRPCWGGKI